MGGGGGEPQRRHYSCASDETPSWRSRRQFSSVSVLNTLLLGTFPFSSTSSPSGHRTAGPFVQGSLGNKMTPQPICIGTSDPRRCHATGENGQWGWGSALSCWSLAYTTTSNPGSDLTKFSSSTTPAMLRRGWSRLGERASGVDGVGLNVRQWQPAALLSADPLKGVLSSTAPEPMQ